MSEGFLNLQQCWKYWAVSPIIVEPFLVQEQQTPFFLQGSSKLDILLTCSFQFCVGLSLKCSGWWVFFFPAACNVWDCKQSLSHSYTPSTGLFLTSCVSEEYLCCFTTSLFLTKEIIKIMGILLVWSGMKFCPDHLGPVAEQLQPRPAHISASQIQGVWKKQNKKIFLKIRKVQVAITTRLLSTDIVHFSKMCAWFSVN